MQTKIFTKTSEQWKEDTAATEQISAALEAHLPGEKVGYLHEVHFAKQEGREQRMTISYFHSLKAACDGLPPLYAITTDIDGNKISESFFTDTPLVREVFSIEPTRVPKLVTEQLIESRREDYPPGSWFEHPMFGRACMYEDVTEMTR